MTEQSLAALADRVIAVTGTTRRRLLRATSTPFPGEGLTTAQVELVRHVRRNPGCTVTEAAGALGLAPNTVSTLVRVLSTSGHMLRTADAVDGRVVRLELSDEARRDLERWRDRRQSLVAEALRQLGPEQRERLASGLDALTELTEALDSEAVAR
ncbi:MAG TPA: MarR family transcriptional regulator [Propionibacteriaceae bacterium]|nr:MarR family transcriptional regulator [Propionibacteriaceae bacterium]